MFVACCFALLFAIACARSEKPVGRPFSTLDRGAIQVEILHFNREAQRAWALHDASILIPDTTEAGVAMRADLQRRMDMTTRVDTMTEVLDTLQMLGPDSVLAFSKQRFVRVIQLPGGEEKQRISTVTHARTFVRRGGVWENVGPLVEHDQRAWWAGETPPAQ